MARDNRNVPTVAVLNDTGNLVTLESTYISASGNGVIAQVSFAYGGPDVTVPANDDCAKAA